MSDYLDPYNDPATTWGHTGHSSPGDQWWQINMDLMTKEDTEGRYAPAEIEAALLSRAIGEIQSAGLDPQARADAMAKVMQDSGKSAHAIAQVTGMPLDEIVNELSVRGYDISGNPVAGNDMASDGTMIGDFEATAAGTMSIEDLAAKYGWSVANATSILSNSGAGATAPDPLGALGIPVDGDYSAQEQDQIAGLIDSGQITVAEAADYYGVPVADAQAAYDARPAPVVDSVPDYVAPGTLTGPKPIPGMGPTQPQASTTNDGIDPNTGLPYVVLPSTNAPNNTNDGADPGNNVIPGVNFGTGTSPTSGMTQNQLNTLFGTAPTGGTNISTSPTIPPFLQDFLLNSANASNTGISGLQNLLSQPNALVQPFNQQQQDSLSMAEAFARDPNGLLTQAQNVFSGAADDTELRALFGEGKNLLANPLGQSNMQGFMTSSPLNQVAQSQLEGTAQGDYMYGSPGFDEAVQASIRAARPNILSRFSQGGSGSVTGGLAQAAIQQAASDSFAGQYGDERNRQLNASNQLNTAGLNQRQLQQGAAGNVIGAQQQAGQSFTDSANQERGRQLNAAAALPQLGLLQSGILGDVGNTIQQQDERSSLGEIQQMQQLMGSAFGNINPTALFGSSENVPMEDSNTLLNILGGGATGSALLQQIFPDWNNAGTWGAAGGGLLGWLEGRV